MEWTLPQQSSYISRLDTWQHISTSILIHYSTRVTSTFLRRQALSRRRPRLRVLETPVSTGWRRLHWLQSLMLRHRLVTTVNYFWYILSPCQIRFALSSSPIFSRTDTVTDSERFYRSILNLLDDADEQEEVNDLLMWWNRYVVTLHRSDYPWITITLPMQVKFFRIICPRGAQSVKTVLWQGSKRSELSWKPWLWAWRVEISCSRLTAGFAFQKLSGSAWLLWYLVVSSVLLCENWGFCEQK
jgi:hypothetical protein